jgi:hypothetical protein
MADIEGVSEYVPLTETPSPELAPTPSEDPSLAQTTPQEEAPETAPPPAPAPEPTAIESPMVQLNEPDAPKPQVAPAQEPAAIAVGNAVTEPVDSANPGDTVAVESKSTPPPEAAVVTASAVGDPQVMSSQSATVTKTPDDAPAGTAVTTASVVTQQSAVTDLQNTTQNSIRTSAVIGLDVSQSSAAITDTSPTVPNSAANVSAVTVTKNASTTNDATNGATTDTKPGVGVAADAPVGALTAMVGVPNVAALKVESTTGGLTAFQSTTMANSAPGGFLTPEAKARAVTQPSAGVNTAPLASTLGNSAGSVLKLTATQTGPQTGTQTATPIPPLNSAASAAGVTAPATWANFDGKVPIDAVAGLPGAMLGTKIFDNAAATKVPTGTSTSTLSSVSTNGTSSVTKQATDTNLSTGVTTAPISTTLNSGASVAGKPFQSLFSPTALVGGLANPAAPGTPAAPALSGTLQSILGQTNAKGSPQTAASEWKSSPFALPSSKFEQAVTAQAAKDAAAGKPVDAAIPRSLGDATAAAPALGATPSVEVAGPKQVVDLRNLTTMKPFVGPEQQPYGPVPMPEMGGKPTGVPMPDFSGTNTGIPMPGMTTLPDLKGDATPRPFLGIGGAPDKGGAVPMPFMGLGEIAGKPVQGPVPALSTTPTNVAGAAVPAKNALTQDQIDRAVANGAVLGKDIALPQTQPGNGNPTLTASDINGIKNSGDPTAATSAALAGKSAQPQTLPLGTGIDRNSVASANLFGNPSTAGSTGAVDPSLVAQAKRQNIDPAAKNAVVRADNGVEGWLTNGEVKQLRNDYVNDPSMQNALWIRSSKPEYVNSNAQEVAPLLAATALLTYMRGDGGAKTLPANTYTGSDVYYKDPAQTTTTSLLNRAFQGASNTPGTENLTQRMAKLKPGESITFKDYQSSLIDRDAFSMANKSLNEKQLWATLGNATHNTNADVKIRYDGPEKGFTMNVRATHVLGDKYDWNADAKSPSSQTEKSSDMPGGRYGKMVTLNHADLKAMEDYGAKPFTVVAAASQDRVYKIPARQIHPDPSVPFHMPNRAELGSSTLSMEKFRVGNVTNAEITNQSSLRTAVNRASEQNPRAGFSVAPNQEIKPLKPHQYNKNSKDAMPVDPKLAELTQARREFKHSEMMRKNTPMDPTR